MSLNWIAEAARCSWKIEGASRSGRRRTLAGTARAGRRTERQSRDRARPDRENSLAVRHRSAPSWRAVCGTATPLHRRSQFAGLVWRIETANRSSLLLTSTVFFSGARSFRDGQMAYVNNQGQYVRLDATGKEVKRYIIPFDPNFGMNSVEILPNDHVLVSAQAASKLHQCFHRTAKERSGRQRSRMPASRRGCPMGEPWCRTQTCRALPCWIGKGNSSPRGRICPSIPGV